MLSPETRPSVAEVGDGWVLGRAAADELGVEPGMIMTVDDHRAEVSAVVDTEGRNPQMSRRIMFLTAPHGRSAQCLIEYESGVARGRTEAASVVIRRFRSPSIRMGIWSTVSTKRQPNASTTPSSSPASNHSSLAHRTWASTARPIDPDVKLGAYATTSARIPKATCIPRDSHIRTDTYRSRLNGTNAQPGTRSPSTRRPMHRSRTRKRVRRERHDMRPATRIRGVEQHTSHNARHSNGGTHEQQSAIKTPSQLDAASKTPNIRHCVHRRSPLAEPSSSSSNGRHNGVQMRQRWLQIRTGPRGVHDAQTRSIVQLLTFPATTASGGSP